MTTARRELLQLLGDISEHDGDLRLGQLVTNLATLARGANVEAIWDSEDDELTLAARTLLAKYQQRKESAA